MSDDLTVCAAAFFRSKGKTVVTESEFLMGISMDLHWMPHNDAKKLLETMIKKKIVERSGEYIKPLFDVSKVNVPVAYKPKKEIVSSKNEITNNETIDILPSLIAESAEFNIEKREFISQCNVLQKRLNIDIEAAGLIILRDHGMDVTSISEKVYECVTSK